MYNCNLMKMTLYHDSICFQQLNALSLRIDPKLYNNYIFCNLIARKSAGTVIFWDFPWSYLPFNQADLRGRIPIFSRDTIFSLLSRYKKKEKKNSLFIIAARLNDRWTTRVSPNIRPSISYFVWLSQKFFNTYYNYMNNIKNIITLY